MQRKQWVLLLKVVDLRNSLYPEVSNVWKDFNGLDFNITQLHGEKQLATLWGWVYFLDMFTSVDSLVCNRPLTHQSSSPSSLNSSEFPSFQLSKFNLCNFQDISTTSYVTGTSSSKRRALSLTICGCRAVALPSTSLLLSLVGLLLLISMFRVEVGATSRRSCRRLRA